MHQVQVHHVAVALGVPTHFVSGFLDTPATYLRRHSPGTAERVCGFRRGEPKPDAFQKNCVPVRSRHLVGMDWTFQSVNVHNFVVSHSHYMPLSSGPVGISTIPRCHDGLSAAGPRSQEPLRFVDNARLCVTLQLTHARWRRRVGRFWKRARKSPPELSCDCAYLMVRNVDVMRLCKPANYGVHTATGRGIEALIREFRPLPSTTSSLAAAGRVGGRFVLCGSNPWVGPCGFLRPT
mgnify:CR=1 FL=1